MNHWHLLTILTTFFIVFTGFETTASHISGGDITYEHISGTQFAVKLRLYRDCSGITLGDFQSIMVQSACGVNQSYTADTPDLGYPIDATSICSGLNTNCGNGNINGYQLYQWSYTINMDSTACADWWTISWDECCRNPAIVNLVDPSNAGTYLETKVNFANAPQNNSSAQFSSNIIENLPVLCQGQEFIIPFLATDPNAHRLTYNFTAPLNGPNTPIGFNAPYSTNYPIDGAAIDSTILGLVGCRPLIAGDYVVSVMVKEYDINDSLIGTVIRDLQFSVVNCATPAPYLDSIQYNNITGSGFNAVTPYPGLDTYTDLFFTIACPSDSVCYDFTNTTLSNLDLISVYDQNHLPNFNFNSSGAGSINICTGQINPSAPNLIPIVNLVTDSTCGLGQNYVTFQSFFHLIFQIDEADLGPDRVVCNSQFVNLNPLPSQLTSIASSVDTALANQINNHLTVNWYDITDGSPVLVTPGPDFSCNPCLNPTIQPSTTTTYVSELVFSGASSCTSLTDTITINVVSNFTHDMNRSVPATCVGEEATFWLNLNPQGNYQIQWHPSNIFTEPNNDTTTTVFLPPYTYENIYAEITSPDGCYEATDSLSFTIQSGYTPDVDVWTLDSAICNGDTAFLQSRINSTVSALCIAAPNVCSGFTGTAQIGTNATSNTITSYPAPYQDYYENARQQYLIHASELINAGFTGGKIIEIRFDVGNIPTDFGNGLEDYTISMGCTSDDNLTTWQTGLQQVYYTPSFNVTMFSKHFLDLAYEWDGLSNIVVEICSGVLNSGSGVSWTNNVQSAYSTTTFTSAIYYTSDDLAACPTNLTASTSNNRPNMILTTCTGVDTTIITFDWHGNATYENPTGNSTNGTLNSGSNQFLVTVTDTTTGCSTDLTVDIDLYAEINALTTDTVICEGVSTTLSAQQVNGIPLSNLSYSWSGAGVIDSPNSQTTLVTPPSSPTTYTVTATDLTEGCVSSSDLTISWFPNSATLFTANPMEGVSPFSVDFTNQSDSSIIGFNWTFGDLVGTSNFSDPSYFYDVPAGQYTITLNGTDVNGCITQHSIEIKVLDQGIIIVPNVFSPNGDGINDEFGFIDFRGVKEFEGVIYNRWGQKVYDWTNPAKPWDGGDQSEGTYFYVIKAVGNNGSPIEMSGDVTLMK